MRALAIYVLAAVSACGLTRPEDTSLPSGFQKESNYWSCHDFPWLTTAVGDRPGAWSAEFGVYACTCRYEMPDCAGTDVVPGRFHVEVLARTYGQALACGDSRCGAWVLSNPPLREPSFFCGEAPIDYVPDWVGAMPIVGEFRVRVPSRLPLCGGRLLGR